MVRAPTALAPRLGRTLDCGPGRCLLATLCALLVAVALPRPVAAYAHRAENAHLPPTLKLRAEHPPATRLAQGHLVWHAVAPSQLSRSRAFAELRGVDNKFHAKLWLAQSPAGLHVAVDVTDAVHRNNQQGEQLWDGDAVQLALHPIDPEEVLGLAAGEAAASHDLLLTLALTNEGAAGWVHVAGNGNLLGPWPYPLNVEREATSATTRYETCVPWQTMDLHPGAIDALALSLWVLDGGNGYAGGATTQAGPRRLRFGASAAGGLRPQDMAVATLAAPAAPWASLGPATATLLAGQEGFRLPVRALADPAGAPLTLRMRCGSWDRALYALPAALHHVLVGQFDAGGCPSNQSAQVLLETKAGKVLAQVFVQPLNVAAHLQQADRQLAATAEADPAGAAAGVQSLRGMLATLVAQAEMADVRAPRGEVAALDGLAQQLAEGYQDPLARTQAQANGTLPQLFTFVAAGDQTMQPYKLTLPRHHTPQRAQPLVVVLHGRGDPRLATFLGDVATASPNDVKRPGAGLSHAYVMTPWARGNWGAQGIGEQDVLQAVQQVQSRFAIDANRIFLLGFSLGGTGAWSLALHDPDPWAGVAVLSGGTWLTSLGHRLGANVAGLPVFVWHGTADGAVDVAESHRMAQELQQTGNQPMLTFAAGQGHTFAPTSWTKVQAYFADKARARPAAWRYTADGPLHRCSRGICLAVDAQRDPYPWVEVRHTGNALYITSHGTAGLELDLGPQGMDLAGEASVYYQGQKVWHGLPTRLQLGAGAARP